MGTRRRMDTRTVVAGAGIAIVGVTVAGLAAASSPALAFGEASSAVTPGSASALGGVIAWDINSSGEFPVPPEALSGVTAVSSGGYYGLALKGGRVIAWENNPFAYTPVPQSAQSGVTAISACTFSPLALKNGKVIAWGLSRPPASVMDSTDIVAISANFTRLALKGDRVIAWSGSGETPVPPAVQSGVTAIEAGQYQSLALKNGEVIFWDNETGKQLPVPSSVKSGVTAISAERGPAALKDGAVIRWTDVDSSELPVPDEAKSDVVAISGDFALKRSGEVITWTNDFFRPGNPVVLGTVPAAAKSGITAISQCFQQVLAIGPETADKPGPVTNLKATPRKGALRVTWAAPADGTLANSYEYRVGTGTWTPTSGTSVTIKGNKGVRLTVSVRALNAAGAGPTLRVSGTPK